MNGDENMKSSALPRSLKISTAVIICLNIFVFLFLGISIYKMSRNTIEDMGTTYMDGMNEQVSLHFATIIDLRFKMAESIAQAASGGNAGYGTKEEIAYSAQTRNFLCAALYSSDGKMEMIYGDPVDVNHPEPFLDSLKNEERKIASAVDSSGNNIILFGVPCKYPMSDGSISVAIAVGLPSEYVGEVLFLDANSPLMFSYVIREDGSYVIRDGEDFQGNFFDRLYDIFDDQKEKADSYIRQIKAMMNADEDYSVIVLKNNNSYCHLYCARLPYCEWYLVTVLSFDGFDNAILGMGSQWLVIVYAAFFAIIAMLLYIFFQYLKVYRKQVSELERMNTAVTTAHKAAKQAQKEAEEANMAKQDFLSNMSHDIRTPMNAIIGMTSIAIANMYDQEKVQECLGKIQLSSKHLLGLINNVLDMSKIESGKMTLNMDPVSLREVIDCIVNIIQPQAEAKSQRFNANVHEMIAENVCCDSVRLNQVLINLLGNAVKYTPDNGSVQLSVYQEASPEDVSCVRTHFIVKDTGIGMSEEYQQKIFDSFSREENACVQKTEGTGLGMAITKHIVDMMGGTISVQSEQGKGSEFHVVLDLKKSAGVCDGEDEEEKNLELGGKRILLAEDNEINWEVARELLSTLKLELEWAENGQICVEKFEKSPVGYYDAIIMDIRMPVMDGYEAAMAIRRLEREDADIPILAMTADAFSEDVQKCLDCGMNDHLAKPIDLRIVEKTLRKYLR